MAEEEYKHHRRRQHHHFFRHDGDEVEPAAPAEDKLAEHNGQLTHHHGLFHHGLAHDNKVEDEEEVVKRERHGLSSLFHRRRNQDVIPVMAEGKGEHHHGFFHLRHHHDEDSMKTKPAVLEEREGNHSGLPHPGHHDKVGGEKHHHGFFHLHHHHGEDSIKIKPAVSEGKEGHHHGLLHLGHHDKVGEEKHHYGFFHLHRHHDEDSIKIKPAVSEGREGHHQGLFHLGHHNQVVQVGDEKHHRGHLHLHGLFHHHKEAPPPPPEKHGAIAHIVNGKAEQLFEKEVKRHQRIERVAEAASISAGALALYEKHEEKKDPDHAMQHKLDETIAHVVSEEASGVSLLEDRLAKVAEADEERVDQGSVPLALDLHNPTSLKARFARIFCCFLDLAICFKIGIFV